MKYSIKKNFSLCLHLRALEEQSWLSEGENKLKFEPFSLQILFTKSLYFFRWNIGKFLVSSTEAEIINVEFCWAFWA